MTHQITKLVSALTIAIVTLVASQAKADIYSHIDQSALVIQEKSRILLNETVHYRNTPEYPQLVIATNDLTRLATHVHDVTHFEGNLVRLRADLAELGRQFHALEDCFDAIERRAAYGRGVIRTNTAHVKDLLNCIEDAIYLIQCDVDKLISRSAAYTVKRPVYVPNVTRQVYVPTRPIYVPTRPVNVPSRSASINIQFNKSKNRPVVTKGGYGNAGKGPSKGGNSRYGNNDRRGPDYNRGRSRGSSRSGFSIGGGSSKVKIRF